MKCAYESVLSQQKLEKVCARYGTAFLQYCDASLAVNMHDIFGFGTAKRLSELFDEQNPRLNEQMQVLAEDDDEDLWETTINTYYCTIAKIRDAVGWTPEKATEEMPVKDNWKQPSEWKFAKKVITIERDKHTFRQQFLGTMEIKLAVYWNMILLYLITDHGFGAVRLERLYRALRRDYVEFAEKYLEGYPDTALLQMIKDMQEKAAKFGCEFHYDTANSGAPIRTMELEENS